MKTLAEYQQDITQADRVRRLVAMPEYEVFKVILKRMYDRDVERIINAEDGEARARIKFNKDLLDEIQSDIDRGKVATDAINEGRTLESA